MLKRIKRISSELWLFHGISMITLGVCAIILEMPLYALIVIFFIVVFSMFID